MLDAVEEIYRLVRGGFPHADLYLVGGVVRDLLLGRERKDLDFVIRKVPAADLERLLASHGSTVLAGKTFGVFKFTPRGDEGEIDIALPRREESIGETGGYRDFEVQSDPNLPIEEDLARRDFTINAMALRLPEQTRIDPFGGAADLKKNLIRAVGDPIARFSEDYTRLLRAIRLACQLDFALEQGTAAALRQLMPQINRLRADGTYVAPRETVGKEIVKAFAYDPAKALDLLDESGAAAALTPELLPMRGCPQPTNYHSEGDVWTHTRLALSMLTAQPFRLEFPEGFDAETALAVLLHDIGKPYTIQTPQAHGTDRIRFNEHDRVGADLAKKICERLKLSQFPKGDRLHVDCENLGWLVEKHLLLVHGSVEEMKGTTLEKYFLSRERPSRSLLKVIFCDGSATIPEGGGAMLKSYGRLRERLAEITKEKQTAPSGLLSGEEVMEALSLPPGPEIGRALAALREEQLSGRIKTKEEARKFLRNSTAPDK